MRPVLFVILGSLFAAPPCLCQAAAQPRTLRAPGASVPNFSGTWRLDTERSWIATPNKEPLPAETLGVRQTDTVLIVDGVSEPISLARRVRARRDGGVYETNSEWKDGRLTVTTTVTRQSTRIAPYGTPSPWTQEPTFAPS